MSRLGSRVRAAVNPASTAATRWWCHAPLRQMLTGAFSYGEAGITGKPAIPFRPRATQICGSSNLTGTLSLLGDLR
jgi:hypothetical protein